MITHAGNACAKPLSERPTKQARGPQLIARSFFGSLVFSMYFHSRLLLLTFLLHQLITA
jgi:hypothetical protein